jgi:putative oxidoreductase
MILGVGFMVHGWAKWSRGPVVFAELLKQAHVPLPLANAWLVTLLEIFGGLALLIGAFVTIVSVPLILSMLGAMLTVNIKYGFSAVKTIGLTPEGPQLGPPGYEINLLYIACLVVLILGGAGPLSIDALRSRRGRRHLRVTALTVSLRGDPRSVSRHEGQTKPAEGWSSSTADRDMPFH